MSEPASAAPKESMSMEWVLGDEEMEDIEAIASQLNYDPDKAKSAILELLSSSMYQLWYWMDQSALSSLAGWKHFGRITGQLEQRLDENTERIKELAAQLTDKRESVLEKVYRAKGVRIPDVDLMLDTLSLEIRFHSLAAKLKAKLARKLRDIRGRWLNHSLRMLPEMTEITDQLMTELGIQQTGLEDDDEISGLILNPFYCDAIRFLRDFSYCKLSDCWNLPPEARRRFAPESKDLRDLVRYVTCSNQADGSNASTVESNSIIRVNNTAGDNNFFQDRFGWNSIFRGSNSSDNPDEALGNGDSNDASQAINSNFAEEFRRALPKLMKCGGAVRNILMIGSRIESSLQPTHFQQITKCQATTVSDPIPTRCSLFCIGEEIDLEELIQSAWAAIPNLQELSRRLRSTQAKD